ncbi:unnamed protein product [Pedinophyceae sp. YPF-701]|nr:unnamed protein product [Pedinophyceae sp. YPF-701]
MATITNVIQLVNKLQSLSAPIFQASGSSNADLPNLWSMLPKIIVIGGQSSGKSSVLEAIVGRECLPRGTGIVTKRPLVLKLEHIGESDAQEWCEFLHLPGKKFTDFEEVRKEIRDDTERLLRRIHKDVSPETIQLTIHSPHVPNLTLVDMPGLTKVAMDGQPASIVDEIKDMVRSFIEDENSVILAVSPANADMATSDAINMARSVDPQGLRTIGVLTKIDIMDRGTSARDVLRGGHIKLRHGWVGVVNRGQADIDSRVPMADIRARELEFFRTHAEYKDLANVGTGRLAEKLSVHLRECIERQVPRIATQLREGIGRLKTELEGLGGEDLQSAGAMRQMVGQQLAAFQDAFKRIAKRGHGGGEKILHEVFLRQFVTDLQEVDFAELCAPESVARVVKLADGLEAHLLASERGCRELVKQAVALLEPPALRCVDAVHAHLEDFLERAMSETDDGPLRRFPNLRRDIVDEASRFLNEKLRKSREFVRTLIAMEGDFPHPKLFHELQHNDALDIRDQRGHRFEYNKDAPGDLSPELREAFRLGRVVHAYMLTVCNQLREQVPKAVVFHQIKSAQKDLVSALNRDASDMSDAELRDVLAEDEWTVRRRQDVRERLRLLQAAQEEIAAFRRQAAARGKTV